MLDVLAMMTGRPTDPDAGARLDALRRAAWRRLGLTRDRGMVEMPGFPPFYGSAFVFREGPRDRAEPRDWIMIQALDDSQAAADPAFRPAYLAWLQGHMRALHAEQRFPFATICTYRDLPLPDGILARQPDGHSLFFTDVEGVLTPPHA